MPLILRTVEPKYLSRQVINVNDHELEAVTNNTLTNVLRQLASLVLLASEVFEGLAESLQVVHQRSCSLRAAIDRVDTKLADFNPKTVTVPESDICTFSQRTVHFHAPQPLDGALFTSSNRPDTIRRLYEAAAPTPVRTIRSLDQFRRDGTRSSKLFVCTPVLQGRRKRWRKLDLDIETRKPSAMEDLRRWTSTEALGDVTVQPNNTVIVDRQEEPADHLLPSPEEQMMAVALRYPPSIVPVDVSGRAFDRLSTTRRSLTNIQSDAEPSSSAAGGRRRRGRRRDKRRNTLAGTSHKEIEAAVAGETTTETEGIEFEPLAPLRAGSGEIFKVRSSTADTLKSQLHTLKQWSRGKLRAAITRNHGLELSSSRPSFEASDLVDDDVTVYERVGGVRRGDKGGSSTSVDTSIANSIVVKLRENSLQRRYRRAGVAKTKDEPAHSSSGNWSASSESGRTSIASETTTAPKSTSTATSTNSLHHGPPSAQSRRRVLASGSSSVSEGTLTPDINDIDGETSSVYSCDTEGYYTSFHVDSGLKTLKEEDIGLSASSLRLNGEQNFPNFQPSHNRAQLTAENEYELFGKGSTSTTTSSAGTVCTTLLAGQGLGSSRSLSGFAPAVPERKSSLDRKERSAILVADSPSPDSGHNTSSSPGDSTGQVESDLEGERVERLRSKTAMTAGRIPSMVAITPPVSDEEVGPQAPLRIAIPDLYALPDKRRREVKTISNNGVLETNLDGLDENRPAFNVTVDKNTGYATIQNAGTPTGPRHYTVEREVAVVTPKNSKPMSPDYVSLNAVDSSLERRRQGARVTLDSEGKVVYSSDSLKRKKDHSTFVPGKFVRESPTPSPLMEHRTPKAVRPVNTSGLVKTNGDVTDGSGRRSESPRVDARRSVSPKVESRRSVSPKEDRKSPRLGKVFVRSPTRVVSPITTKKSPSNTLDHPKRNVQNLMQPPNRVSEEEKRRMLNLDVRKDMVLRSASPAPSNISTSSSKRSTEYEEDERRRWVSEHPSAPVQAAQAAQAASTSTFPRTHPMYWTLPSRPATEDPQQKSSTPTKPIDRGLDLTLSPITSPRTTMTSEELFAAIHRSKKRLNLKKEEQPRKPESNATASAKTSLQNFKMLLLQRGGKDSGRMSAVEQLRLSKDVKTVKDEPVRSQTPPKMVKKNQWRFASPRSDVLSSTILEDCTEAERPEDALRHRTELESSPLMRRGRGDFEISKPPRAIVLQEQRRVMDSPLLRPQSPEVVRSLGRGDFELPKPPRAIMLQEQRRMTNSPLFRPQITEDKNLQRRGSEPNRIPTDFEESRIQVQSSVRGSPLSGLPVSRGSPQGRSIESIEVSKLVQTTEKVLTHRSLPDPPQYTDSLGRSSPRRQTSNTYAKITAPLPTTPTRTTEKEIRLIQNHSSSSSKDVKPTVEKPIRKSLQDARKDFFAERSPPTTAVPYDFSRRFSPFPLEAGKNSISNGLTNQKYSHSNLANGNAPFSSSSRALSPSSNEKSARSPNVSLETAL